MKKSKTKLIIPSLLTILGCIAIGSGSTYSLFTSSNENKITISSGKVDITSSLSIEKVYSPTSIKGDGTISDTTNGATFTKGNTSGTFKNGGSISIDTDGNIALDKLSPGDKVILKLDIKNNSTISSNYMYELKSSSGLSLYSLLDIKIYDNEGLTTLSSDIVSSVNGIRSKSWTNLSGVDTETTVASKYISIELPSSLDIGMGLSTSLSLKVEGVQGNGVSSSLYTLPSEISESSFDNASSVHIYANNINDKEVTDGTSKATAYYNGVYFDGLNSAISYITNKDSSATNPIIYLKPNSTTVEGSPHAAINGDLTIYGNNATLGSGGEVALYKDDNSDGLTSSATVNIYDLNNLTLWGYHKSNNEITFNVKNTKMKSVYVVNKGSTSNLNFNFDTCYWDTTYGYSDTGIYSNSNGTISLNNCVIEGYNKALGLSHKVSGTETVKVVDSSFIDCSTNSKADDYAPIRLKDGSSGAIHNFIMKNSNIYYRNGKSPVNGYDIMLNMDMDDSSDKNKGTVNYYIDDESIFNIRKGNNVAKKNSEEELN